MSNQEEGNTSESLSPSTSPPVQSSLVSTSEPPDSLNPVTDPKSSSQLISSPSVTPTILSYEGSEISIRTPLNRTRRRTLPPRPYRHKTQAGPQDTIQRLPVTGHSIIPINLSLFSQTLPRCRPPKTHFNNSKPAMTINSQYNSDSCSHHSRQASSNLFGAKDTILHFLNELPPLPLRNTPAFVFLGCTHALLPSIPGSEAITLSPPSSYISSLSLPISLGSVSVSNATAALCYTTLFADTTFFSRALTLQGAMLVSSTPWVPASSLWTSIAVDEEEKEQREFEEIAEGLAEVFTGGTVRPASAPPFTSSSSPSASSSSSSSSSSSPQSPVSSPSLSPFVHKLQQQSERRRQLYECEVEAASVNKDGQGLSLPSRMSELGGIPVEVAELYKRGEAKGEKNEGKEDEIREGEAVDPTFSSTQLFTDPFLKQDDALRHFLVPPSLLKSSSSSSSSSPNPSSLPPPLFLPPLAPSSHRFTRSLSFSLISPEKDETEWEEHQQLLFCSPSLFICDSILLPHPACSDTKCGVVLRTVVFEESSTEKAEDSEKEQEGEEQEKENKENPTLSNPLSLSNVQAASLPLPLSSSTNPTLHISLSLSTHTTPTSTDADFPESGEAERAKEYGRARLAEMKKWMESRVKTIVPSSFSFSSSVHLNNTATAWTASPGRWMLLRGHLQALNNFCSLSPPTSSFHPPPSLVTPSTFLGPEAQEREDQREQEDGTSTLRNLEPKAAHSPPPQQKLRSTQPQSSHSRPLFSIPSFSSTGIIHLLFVLLVGYFILVLTTNMASLAIASAHLSRLLPPAAASFSLLSPLPYIQPPQFSSNRYDQPRVSNDLAPQPSSPLFLRQEIETLRQSLFEEKRKAQLWRCVANRLDVARLNQTDALQATQKANLTFTSHDQHNIGIDNSSSLSLQFFVLDCATGLGLDANVSDPFDTTGFFDEHFLGSPRALRPPQNEQHRVEKEKRSGLRSFLFHW